MAQAKLSSVSKSPSVDIFARDGRRVAAEPVERQVERVAPVIHRDAAAGEAPLAPPVAAPLVDALGVRVAERLQGHELDRADEPRVEHLPHRLDDRRVLVVVAGEEHAPRLARVRRPCARASAAVVASGFSQST